MKRALISMLIFMVVSFLCVSFLLIYERSRRIEAEQQRDEAYELARKAQNSAMCWYDVHEKMVWHTQPNEETK